ncbi:MAG: hypothetical protein ABIV51_04755 [Saprospiraceae bacterium]
MQLNFQSKRPLIDIFSYLSDMDKFVKVHPVIYKINTIGDNKYKAYETLKMGFLPITFNYSFTVEADPNTNAILIRATVMKLTTIEMTFTLSHQEGLTDIVETIQFRSVLPVKSIMRKVFRKQHRLLFENIEKATYQPIS